MQEQLEVILQKILALYGKLIEVTNKETHVLANIKLDCLNAVIKTKKDLVKEIAKLTNQASILLKNDDKARYSHYMKAIKKLSTKLDNLNQVNFQIAQQHIAFSQSMINLYLGFQVNQIYNNKCLISYKSLKQG